MPIRIATGYRKDYEILENNLTYIFLINTNKKQESERFYLKINPTLRSNFPLRPINENVKKNHTPFARFTFTCAPNRSGSCSKP